MLREMWPIPEVGGGDGVDFGRILQQYYSGSGRQIIS